MTGEMDLRNPVRPAFKARRPRPGNDRSLEITPVADPLQVCIHGHFYQPPRENPWLGVIERQDSAHPYHDWNERITAECYGPNAAATLLHLDGNVAAHVNNYAQVSFNFGPTLFSWLHEHAPTAYQAIIQADGDSCAKHNGHGNAIAQPYNHMIMPLATPRDQNTQVIWGIRDFEHRFARSPEGMWLPETAVDVATLEVMATHGIAFTILAPHQAHRVRRLGSGTWTNVTSDEVDTSMPYLARLPSGRSIAIFFYHGPVAQAVAFEGLLANGERFAQRLLSSRRAGMRGQLLHLATDGETYGHHHSQGEMSLAYALRHIEANGLAAITNYGEYLATFPPDYEVEIVPQTSWSCAHGIGRWQEDCGCSAGGRSDWNQRWRVALRSALDWLRDTLSPLYEERATSLLGDAWAARDDYISVVLHPTPERIGAFFARRPRPGDKTLALELLELQRMTMLMYTSCGWFFDDISGIESVQCLCYAARAAQIGHDLFGLDLESGLIERLAAAPSNVPEHRNGAVVYATLVRPAMRPPRP